MPLYEYQCDRCGHRFEVIQRFSDSPVRKCPVCGGTVQKLQSAPAFQFKGTGWYVTDYAKKDQPAATKSDNGSAPGTENKTSKEGSETGDTKSSADSSSSNAQAKSTPSTPRESSSES